MFVANTFSFFKIRHCCILNYIVSTNIQYFLHILNRGVTVTLISLLLILNTCHRNYMYSQLNKNQPLHIHCMQFCSAFNKRSHLIKDHIYGDQYMNFISCQLKELMYCVPQCELWQGTHKLVNQISNYVLTCYTIALNETIVFMLHLCQNII